MIIPKVGVCSQLISEASGEGLGVDYCGPAGLNVASIDLTLSAVGFVRDANVFRSGPARAVQRRRQLASPVTSFDRHAAARASVTHPATSTRDGRTGNLAKKSRSSSLFPRTELVGEPPPGRRRSCRDSSERFPCKAHGVGRAWRSPDPIGRTTSVSRRWASL